MTTQAPVIRTYSHWSRPQSAGLGKLGSGGTSVMFAGLIVVALLFFVNFWLSMAALALLGLALGAIVYRNADGLNVVDRVIERAGFVNAKQKGANLYRSGPLSRIPWGSHQLPGIAAGSKLYEYQDSNFRPFALIHLPSTDHYTVVIETQPDGSALVDQEQIDGWVASWGFWLNSLADEPGLEAVTVTIETAPDTGKRFEKQVRGATDPDAPAFAVQMLEELIEQAPHGSALTRAYVALTFKGQTRVGSKRRSIEEVGAAIANRLSGLTSALESTGAGSSIPVDAQELCELILVAYHPTAIELVDDAHAEGTPLELGWNDVGPSAHEAGWDYYRHDSAWSVTWTMTGAPRGLVREQILARLLAPHRDIARKRVTMHYRPIDPGKAAGIVEKDLNDANFSTTGGNKPTARKLKRLNDARRTAEEEASGAGVITFGMSVTATVTDVSRLEDAKSAIDMLGASARVRLRPAYGSQDSAFAATLPLGIVPFRHVKIPTEMRSNL